ncbi:hypothetical protein BX600DRAFT_475498 [Xylariales sp. PMI_506]|nr:hypothetical protein BX600DRAFT_475498 [Xylariales sp. PMI_506]
MTTSTSTITSTNLGPLTTTFTPSLPDCTSIIWAENGDPGWLALAQDIDDEYAAACMPSKFNRQPEYYYSPGICPSGYIYGCSVIASASDVSVASTVATCCPSSYTCDSQRTENLEKIYACYSMIDTQTTLTITSIYYGTSTSFAVTTLTATAGLSVHANGLAVIRGENDIAWTTASSAASASTSTPTSGSMETGTTTGSGGATATGSPSADSSTGLSTGAKAGIGVGAALGALAFLGLGYLLSRWRHQKRPADQGSVAAVAASYQDHHSHGGVPGYPGGGGGVGVYTPDQHYQGIPTDQHYQGISADQHYQGYSPGQSYTTKVEADATGNQYHELYTSDGRDVSELPGDHEVARHN